ncbi:MAG TPA: flagellar motor protein MotB [Bryobacteraceae bacterium]|nr:flagellar motor protein MotB [Bryobacteraceae bacterium]
MIRRAPVRHENHERWLVSYADFITLLFAFFVVMFASTQADRSKARMYSEAVKEALEHGQLSAAISVVLGRGKHEAIKSMQEDTLNARLPPPPPQAHPADLVKSLATLQTGLDAELKSGKVQVKLEARGLVISLRESGFFASGDDAIAPDGLPSIAKIAAVIQGVPNPMRLEGYTDSVPIHNSRFQNNWELSSARSIAMLELLQQKFQIPPERMSVAGYAENAPADTNDTPEGRAHNRRVELVLLSAEAEKAEPKPGQ